VFGGLRERPVPKDATIEKMSDIIENGFKQQCKGMYSANITDVENLAGIKLRKADITCQMGDKGVHVALLMYLTDTNLFSMFMHEASANRKDEANKARDSIAVSIRELAQKQRK
jgi:hypothetical protein